MEKTMRGKEMSGITITGVKVVGSCSKHGGDGKYKDEDMACIDCIL